MITPPSIPSTENGPRLRGMYPLLSIVVLIGMVFALYLQRKQAFFILDDLFFILEDPRMRTTQITFSGVMQMLQGVHPEGARRVISLISLMIDWWRGAGDPWMFYYTNICLHAANSVLVFLLARKIYLVSQLIRPPSVTVAAFFAAALWALHPIHQTAVAYFWQRVAELAAMGVLSALVFYLYGRTADTNRTRRLFFGLSFFCWVFGSLSKENAWIAPALAFLLEIGVMRNNAPNMLATKYEKWTLTLFAGLAVAVLASIFLGIGPVYDWLSQGYQGWDFSLAQRVLTQPAVICFYLTQLLWPAPDRFAIEHDFVVATGFFSPPTTAITLGFILIWAGAAGTLLARQGTRLYGALLLVPLVALSVESSIIPIDMVFEHRMYLPSVAMFVLGALGLAFLPSWIGIPLGGALAASLAFCLVISLEHWNSPLDVYGQAARLAPTSIRVQYNYANRLATNGNYEQAILHYHRSLAITSPSVNRLYAVKLESIHYNLALAFLGLGRTSEAIHELESATQVSPNHVKAHAFLVDLYLKAGQTVPALHHLDKLLVLDPSNQSARNLRNRLQQKL